MKHTTQIAAAVILCLVAILAGGWFLCALVGEIVRLQLGVGLQ